MAEITPVTREEYYLAKAGGQDVPVPSAVTREEYYLEKLSNDSVVVPSPVTRREKFLYFACGGEIDLPSEEKMTRLERLIAKAGGMDVATPTAVTRLEKFWANVEGGGWKVTELTGALPITFRSNGTALINYKIYGTVEGAGVQTENIIVGIISSVNITQNGDIDPTTADAYECCIAPIENGKSYGLMTSLTENSTVYAFFDTYPTTNGRSYDSKRYVVRGTRTVVIAPITGYLVIRGQKAYGKEMVIEGSTAPPTYIPYGYKIPLTVTNGTERKDTDIYIGDSKLLSGDYVDYESGKIVRNGTPQDPPIPFPAIETFNGENTLDSTETLGEVTIKGIIKEAE